MRCCTRDEGLLALRRLRPDRCGRTRSGNFGGLFFIECVRLKFWRPSMSETLTLPVLPLDDEVVLPGMVVPLETSQAEVSAAIDAARLPSRQVPGVRSEVKARVLLVPRLPDRGLAGVGTLAEVEQVGRLPGGQPGAVLRGTARVKIGSGTTGPGAALWVADSLARCFAAPPGSRSARVPPAPARRCGYRAPWSRRPAAGRGPTNWPSSTSPW